MPRYGQYNPGEPENTSTLFVYQEVPVASAKMNCWNGNMAAGLELLHQVGAALLAQGQPAVIVSTDADALKVIATSPPDLTVQVQPGWAVLEVSFAGIKETQPVPVGGVFSPPQNHPRIDCVILRPSGELDVVEGIEAADPVPPSVPSGDAALAQIFLRPGSTQILNSDNGLQSYIIDTRVGAVLGASHQHALEVKPPESPNGSRQQFSTAYAYQAGSLEVFLNGVLQERDWDYSENPDHHSYLFVNAPLSHYRIQHRYLIDPSGT